MTLIIKDCETFDKYDKIGNKNMGTSVCTTHKNSANFTSTVGSLSTGVMNFLCENHDFSNS